MLPHPVAVMSICTFYILEHCMDNVSLHQPFFSLGGYNYVVVF